MRAASVLLLVLSVPVASADEPVALKWSLKEDDTFYATTRVTQTHTGEVGDKKFAAALAFDLTLRYHVKGVKEGETTIEVTYLAVGIRAEGRSGLDGIGEKVRGSTITIRLNENHALTAIRGHDALLKKFRDATDIERETALAVFGEGGARELVGRPFDVLPPKAVRVGETLTRDDRTTVGGLTSTGKTNCKLESLTDGVAKVAVKSDMAIRASDGPAGAKLDLKSERAEGQYTFDTRTGRLKEFAHETVIAGTVTSNDTAVKITIRQKQTVTLSDKNPVRD